MSAFDFDNFNPITSLENQYLEVIKYLTDQNCITALEITVENVFSKSSLNDLTDAEKRQIVDMYKPFCILKGLLDHVV